MLMFMRIYTPDMDALETWTAPTITEISLFSNCLFSAT